jgi:hypothetical protein
LQAIFQDFMREAQQTASGTYKIGFTESEGVSPGRFDGMVSAPNLAANAWTDGAITSSKNEEWFKFTASAATQYVHIKVGTLTDLYVRLYDSTSGTLGNGMHLSGGTTYASLPVISDRVYYIGVTLWIMRQGKKRGGVGGVGTPAEGVAQAACGWSAGGDLRSKSATSPS